MRILLLADARSFHTERYTAELRRQGCRVMVASVESGTMHHWRLKPWSPLQSFRYASVCTQLRKLVSRFKPDLVDAHFASGYGFAASWARLHTRLPLMIHLWGSDILIVPKKSRLHQWKTIHALKRADMVIGDSDYLVNEARRLSPIAHARTILWGIEQRFLSLKKSATLFVAPLSIIVPRPHEPIYRNQFLLQSLRGPLTEDKIKITWPGFGSGTVSFRQLVERERIPNVSFYETLPRHDFLTLLAEHDLYLSGARTDSSPASLIEAMVLGLVPLVPNIPGVIEMVEHDQRLVYDADSETDLVATLTRLLESPDEVISACEKYSDSIRHSAIFENNVAATIDLMKQMVHKRSI